MGVGTTADLLLLSYRRFLLLPTVLSSRQTHCTEVPARAYKVMARKGKCLSLSLSLFFFSLSLSLFLSLSYLFLSFPVIHICIFFVVWLSILSLNSTHFIRWNSNLIFFLCVCVCVCVRVLQVDKQRDNLLFYIIFLRITPFLPNWFINITSPIINVTLWPFWLGTFIGTWLILMLMLMFMVIF